MYSFSLQQKSKHALVTKARIAKKNKFINLHFAIISLDSWYPLMSFKIFQNQ